MPLIRAVRVLVVALAITALLPFPAGAQDQVIKPGSGAARLPAPRPTARQLPDGRIEVTWPAVEGAVRYDLWRSAPPAPQAVVSRPNGAETTYIDSDVKAGSTYYYLVAAVNAGGGSGLRGATPPVTATSSATPASTLAPTGTGTETGGGGAALLSVTATLQRAQPATLQVTFGAVAGATNYRVARVVYRGLPTDPNTMDPSTQTSTPFAEVPSPTTVMPLDQLADATYPRWVRYTVTPVLPEGPAAAGVSNLVSVPAATSTRVTTPVGGTTAGGNATITVAPTATIKAGTMTSLANAGGSGARWMSLNESVATVDAKGTVTGRAGGSTQVVAATAGPDGSLRVVAIPVTVTP